LLAREAEHQALVARLDTLAGYVRQFWDAVEDGLTRIENSELEVGDGRVYVVEVGPRQLVVRVLGENRHIDRAELPDDLALAIADRWFDHRSPTTKVFKGAFMAVSPNYSNDGVRRLWSQAAREGVDLGDLMLVLDDSYDLVATSDR
jgi:hypothetical protein